MPLLRNLQKTQSWAQPAETSSVSPGKARETEPLSYLQTVPECLPSLSTLQGHHSGIFHLSKKGSLQEAGKRQEGPGLRQKLQGLSLDSLCLKRTLHFPQHTPRLGQAQL